MTTHREMQAIINTQKAYMDNKDSVIRGLNDRITELEGGCCRFNCRTARSNFVAGFEEAASNTNYRVCDAQEVYNEYERKGK